MSRGPLLPRVPVARHLAAVVLLPSLVLAAALAAPPSTAGAATPDGTSKRATTPTSTANQVISAVNDGDRRTATARGATSDVVDEMFRWRSAGYVFAAARCSNVNAKYRCTTVLRSRRTKAVRGTGELLVLGSSPRYRVTDFTPPR